MVKDLGTLAHSKFKEEKRYILKGRLKKIAIYSLTKVFIDVCIKFNTKSVCSYQI